MQHAFTVLAVLLAASSVGGAAPEAAQAPAKPNVLLVTVDDADGALIKRAMPYVRAELGARGVLFENHIHSTPLCCPQRATWLRGQYAHNTDVTTNWPPHGGAEAFFENGLHRSTWGVWANHQGYQTIYTGKFLNGYDRSFHPRVPGWDVWNARVADNTYLVGDEPRRFEGEDDGIAAKLGRDAIWHAVKAGKPFAAHISLFAPHTPEDGPDSYESVWANAELPTPPSFDEPDMSDKPEFMQDNPTTSAEDREALTELYRDRLRSARYADVQIRQTIDMLSRLGVLGRTFIIFASDNGYHIREHRLPKLTEGSKGTPYVEDARTPLYLSGPSIPTDTAREEFISGVDLAPTIAKITRASTPEFVDGRSFVPLARGKDVAWRAFGYSEQLDVAQTSGNWRALYLPSAAYHHYPEVDEEEYYELNSDPYQLENQLRDGGTRPALRELAAQMASCEGEECRTAEAP